jgi:hypothetical protein
MGFMKEIADAGNTATTALGGVDAFARAKQANMYFGKGLQGVRNAASVQFGHSAMKAAPGIPGSSAIGVAGAGLSLLGFGNDLWDIGQNGLGVENGLSAATNVTGALGAISPHSAALSFGLQLGQAGDRRLGLSDKSSDLGMWVDEKLGGGTLGKVGGIVGTGAGALASVPFAAAGGLYDLGAGAAGAAEDAGRAILGYDNPLLAGVRDQVAAAQNGTNR